MRDRRRERDGKDDHTDGSVGGGVRLSDTGRRAGYEGDEILLNPLFQFEDTGERGGPVQGRLIRVNRLLNVEKLQLAGCMEAYEEITGNESYVSEEKRKGAGEPQA